MKIHSKDVLGFDFTAGVLSSATTTIVGCLTSLDMHVDVSVAYDILIHLCNKIYCSCSTFTLCKFLGACTPSLTINNIVIVLQLL